MLPAVAVRELVTGNTRVINPDYEAPSGNAVSATANKPPPKLGAHRPAVPVYLVVVPASTVSSRSVHRTNCDGGSIFFASAMRLRPVGM